ncbi:MAG: DEAD/DEAH box helicase, partial [Candidatus Heimdallarchaeota archaeon]
LNKARLIISTIEKLDVLSRNTNYHKLFQSVSVLIIDEIHLLGNEDRGCVLELLLTRIRIAFPNTRIIGLSATIPNVESIASWLQAKSIVFGNDFRPSELVVKTIPYKTSENMFRSKYTRMFKSWTIVKKFLPNQSLVFVTSRGDTVLTAKKYVELVKKDRIPSFAPSSDLSSVKNENLRLCLENNIGFHHAGLSYSDKNLVEKLFKEQMLFVIVATSTLAWGINLPAKVVVIQDIEYNSKEDSLLLSSDIHQMLGRAGRPQFDNKGYGYVLVPENNKREKIEYLLANQENIQSKLPQILPELLLAEIIRNGRSNVDKLEIFLQQTLYWHQQESFPLDQVQLLEDMETELFTLENSHFIFKNDVGSYRATPLGLISNHYYVSVENASVIVK